MPKLYITEFANLGFISGRAVQAPAEPPIAEQAVTFSTATSSAAFNENTRFVRLQADGICSIKFGPSPQTATTNNKRMAAGATEFFGVTPGHIVSVVNNT